VEDRATFYNRKVDIARVLDMQPTMMSQLAVHVVSRSLADQPLSGSLQALLEKQLADGRHYLLDSQCQSDRA
jgi:hypothetical protein